MAKRMAIILAVVFGIGTALYLSLWFASRLTYPVAFGISFNHDHAQFLGLDWKIMYTDMLDDLKPAHIRIAAMWSDVQPVKPEGAFSATGGPALGWDFGNVDFMMDEAKKRNTQVLLIVGHKAPRWPECHVPLWYDHADENSRAQLLAYVSAVVGRYKNHPALELWQVENEPFIPFKFGACQGYDPTAVSEEVALVRSLDPKHKIVITDSGELSTWRKASKAGDILGSTLYRVVETKSGMRWTYDWLPPAVYRLKARLWGKSADEFFISELQAEPWFTDATPFDTPVADQERTMNLGRLEKNFAYVEHVGASRAYLWGVEWWYWMKEKQGDARYWEMMKKVFDGARRGIRTPDPLGVNEML